MLRSCSGHCLARSGKVQQQRFPESLCRTNKPRCYVHGLASSGSVQRRRFWQNLRRTSEPWCYAAAPSTVWQDRARSIYNGFRRICAETASHGATHLRVLLRRLRQNLLLTGEPWCYAAASGTVWQDRGRSSYNGFLRIYAEPASHGARRLVWQAPAGSGLGST